MSAAFKVRLSVILLRGSCSLHTNKEPNPLEFFTTMIAFLFLMLSLEENAMTEVGQFCLTLSIRENTTLRQLIMSSYVQSYDCRNLLQEYI